MLPQVVGSSIYRLLFALSVCFAVIAAVLASQASSAHAKLVYLSDGLYTANDDGSNPRQVTTDASDFYPALSPDAHTIAFFDRFTSDLYLVDANGQNERLLFDAPPEETIVMGRPAFSPDTDQLVFTRWVNYPFGPRDLYRIDLDGQSLTQLTQNDYAEDPAYAPDGNLIAYSSGNNFSGYNQIVTIRPDGSDRREVTPETGIYYDWEAAFSPDGEEIVFTRQTDEIYSQEIWKVNVDGSGLAQLTDSPGDQEWAQDSTWSPDGSQIIYYRNQAGPDCCELRAMNADGSNQRKIVDLGFTPSFQQPNATTIGGELFDNLEVDFNVDPDGDYTATISAADSVYGISRYELSVDSHDDAGYVVKDSVDINCDPECPKQGPTETLRLDGTEVQNGESDLRATAVDGADNPSYQARTVSKKFNVGITEPRLGRTDNPQYPVYGDQRFTDLKPRYFRLLVPWERLDPTNSTFEWTADVGGGTRPGDARFYTATIDDQINRIREIDPGVKIVAVFYRTPCWAIIPQAWIYDPGAGQYKDPCGDNAGGHFPDNNPHSWPAVKWSNPTGGVVAQYKQFVSAFLDKYAGPQVPEDEKIKLYTAWNEPNYFDQAQPQKCKQPHKDTAKHPEFASIPCPPSSPNQWDVTSDDYYFLFYRALYDAVKATGNASIKVLGGETAGVGKRGRTKPDSGEAEFAKSVIKRMRTARRCGPDAHHVKTLGAWSKHSYTDVEGHTYNTVTRLRRTLDGLNPDTGQYDFDTSNCTKNKQLWITELGYRYATDTEGSEPGDPPLDKYGGCLLHDFIDGINVAPVENGKQPDLRRTDIYMQYLYQRDAPYGLLKSQDYDGDQLLDPFRSFSVFNDWAQYAQGNPHRPTRADYEVPPFNCLWGS